MSFIVSFQGQFKPYSLPDLSRYDHIHSIYSAEEIKKRKDIQADEFKEHLKHPQSKHVKESVTAYKKQEKSFKTQTLPHHARDIMSRSMKTMDPNSTVAEALAFQEKYSVNHIPILEEKNKLIGILSDRDLIRRNPGLKIKDVMTTEVLTCLEMTRIQDISKIMLHEKISAIPIINHEYELTGIITRADILGFMTRVISVNQLI